MGEKHEQGDDWRKMLAAADFSHSLAELEERHRAQTARLLLEFLDVLDSLDRLIVASPAAAGLASLRGELLAAFAAAGVGFSEAVGRPFEPQSQEAVETRATSEVEPGSVVEQLTRGCEWQGRVLRRARVVVSKSDSS